MWVIRLLRFARNDDEDLRSRVRESLDGTRKAHSVPPVDEWASPRRE